MKNVNVTLIARDVVSDVSSRDGLETYQRLVSVSSRSRGWASISVSAIRVSCTWQIFVSINSNIAESQSMRNNDENWDKQNVIWFRRMWLFRQPPLWIRAVNGNIFSLLTIASQLKLYYHNSFTVSRTVRMRPLWRTEDAHYPCNNDFCICISLTL